MTDSFFLPGPSGQLEALFSTPRQNAKEIVAIICHPNPLFEGTMHNKVVTTIAKAFDILGITTVRFNFRGVGNSEGEYGETIGETEDCLAVVDWAQKTYPNYSLWLAGFSFGSYISANVANQISVAQLVSIAPAVNHHDFTVFTNINCPWLVIMGDQDEIVPVDKVKAWAANPPSPLDFYLLPGASHFFHGKLIEMREVLVEKLSSGN